MASVPDDPRAEMALNVAAFEQTLRSTIAVAEAFGTQDWALPTDCPGWTVKDVVSHLIGIERALLGDAEPAHAPPSDLPHVRGDLGRMLEVAVDRRRPVPGEQVLAELRETLDRRITALRDIDPAQETMSPDGRMGTYARLMMLRAFDCWVHEQDIRRAVGRPGNLDAPATEQTVRVLTSALPFVVGKRAGAAPGQTVTIEVGEPVPFTRHVVVGDDRRARFADQAPAEPTVTLRTDWETYVRLAAGRCPASDAKVEIVGDADLGRRILDGMATTP